jgi:hypothetical protein
MDILVETGTFRGDMIAATKDRFTKIYSIELSGLLANNARSRFGSDTNVEIIQGDSAVVLPSILSKVEQPAIFWLDGHYSGGQTGRGNSETPILSEIESIHKLRQKQDIIVVDDCRAFGSERDYPQLDLFLDQISEWFGTKPLVANDAIIILPRYK